MRYPVVAAALMAGGAALAAATPASALLVQPIMINLQSNGAHTGAALTVVNDRNKPETVEVTVNSLKLPERGAPILTPNNGDEFLIFPPRATIGPGKTQVFRIRWIGDPTLPESKTYMFSTSELPVNQQTSTGIQLLYSIQSLVTVTSPKLTSDLSIASAVRYVNNMPATPDKPASSEPGLLITFVNQGNALDYLTHYKLRLHIDGPKPWTKVLDTPDVGKAVGLGLVEPNSRRVLFIAQSDIPATGDIKASLQSAPER